MNQTSIVAFFLAPLLSLAPFWIAEADAAGEVFISNNSSSVAEFSTSGSVINSSLITGLSFSSSIALSGNDLYVANAVPESNYFLTTIREYTTSGTLLNNSLVGSFIGQTYSMVVSGNDLFVAGYGNGTITEYNATTGAAISLIASGINFGRGGIAVSGNDVFADNGHSVSEYNVTTGSLINTDFIQGLGAPSGLVAYGGNLFVIDAAPGGGAITSTNGVVEEYSATTGQAINTSLVTGRDEPNGIVASGGDLYVDNNGSGVVGEYTTFGGVVNSSLIGSPYFGSPYYAISVAVLTPEPSTWVMLLIGAAAPIVCGIRQRRLRAGR